MGKLAQKTGIAVESLSGLAYAAKLSDVGIDQLQNSLKALIKAQSEASQGTERQAKVFKSLGVAIKNADGSLRGTQDVLLDLADVFQTLPDGPEKAALAVELFGRKGLDIIPILNQGREGITELTDELKAFGGVITTDVANAADQFGDNLDRLKAASDGFFNQVATALLPTLNELSNQYVEAAKQGDGFKASAEAIADILKFVAAVGYTAAAGIKVLVNTIAGAIDTVKNLGAVAAESFKLLDPRALFRASVGDFTAYEKAFTGMQQAFVRGANSLDAEAGGVSAIIEELTDRFEALYAPADNAGDAIGGTGKAAGKATPPLDLFTEAAAEAGKELSVVEKWLNAAKKAADPFALSTDKLADSWEKFHDAIAKTNAERLDEAFTRRFVEGQQEVQDKIQETAQMWEATWGNLFDSLGSAFGDFISGNLESWEDFGDALKSIARNFLSDLVRQFASTQLRTSFSATGSGVGSGGGFSFGGQQSTLGAGTAFGLSALGGIGASFVGSTNSTTSALGGLTAGASYGALIGSVVPVIGTAIGAVIGGIVGLIGGYFAAAEIPSINLIGSDLIGQSPYRNLAPDARFSTQLGDFAFASIDEVDAEARAQLRKAITEFDNLIAGFLDDEQLARVRDAMANFNLQLQEGAITAENFIQARFDAILGTFDEATQEMVRGAGDLEAQVRKLGEVLQYPQLLADMLEAIGENDLLAGMTEFERGVHQINQSFDDAIANAELFGATQEELAKIETYRANALERLAQLQRQQLDAILDPLAFEEFTEGMSDLDRTIAGINRDFDEMRDRAIELGATEEDLALIERRRTAAIRDATAATEDHAEALETLPDIYDAMADEFDAMREAAERLENDLIAAASGIRDFLGNQQLGTTSSLNPLERLNAAQSGFVELLRGAANRDLESLRALPNAAQDLLNEARAFYGSGEGFEQIEAFVRSALEPFGDVDNSAEFADAISELRGLLAQMTESGIFTAANIRAFSNTQAVDLLNQILQAVRSGNSDVAGAIRNTANRGPRVVA